MENDTFNKSALQSLMDPKDFAGGELDKPM